MTTMLLWLENGYQRAGVLLVMALCLAAVGPWLLGAVLIRERQVGIVIKKVGRRSLPAGRL
ncbi:MAG: hypothetical protein ACREP9_04330, partial [Candidatus Dormibacteraceae bacterium]